MLQNKYLSPCYTTGVRESEASRAPDCMRVQGMGSAPGERSKSALSSSPGGPAAPSPANG